jgi:uncharacterized membrane protein YgcG
MKSSKFSHVKNGLALASVLLAAAGVSIYLESSAASIPPKDAPYAVGLIFMGVLICVGAVFVAYKILRRRADRKSTCRNVRNRDPDLDVAWFPAFFNGGSSSSRSGGDAGDSSGGDGGGGE